MSADKQTLDFIADYRDHTALWDTSDKWYTNKIRRNEAYEALADKYNMTVKGVKSKIKNLRSYYSKEQQKELVGVESSWFAYRHMAFVGDSASRATRDTLTGDNMAYEEIEDGDEIQQENITDVDEHKPEIEAKRSQSADKYCCPKLPLPQTTRGAKRKMYHENQQENMAVDFVEVAANPSALRDACSIFGEMVAAQLRTMSSRSQAIARNKIQNLIFDLEMQEMDASLKETTASQRPPSE